MRTFGSVPKDYQRENGGVIFPNPNAPTGVLMPLEQVEEIIRANQDVVVIVDEAYIDFGGVSALPLIEKIRESVSGTDVFKITLHGGHEDWICVWK